MKLKLLALTLLLVCASLAHASPISYTTTGVFGSSGTNVASFSSGGNTVTLTFLGVSPTVTSTGNISLGAIAASATSGFVNIAATPFTLTILQGFPTAGSGSLAATIAGTVSIDLNTDNTAKITFALPGTVTIGDVTYTPQPLTQLLVSPTTLSGITTIQGVAETPEPASLFLLGTGLVSAGSFMRRRFSTTA